eukprot:1728264-Rhodomonas_salina.3
MCGPPLLTGFFPALRNQTQESTISVHFVPGVRCRVSDFGVHASATISPVLTQRIPYVPATG